MTMKRQREAKIWKCENAFQSKID